MPAHVAIDPAEAVRCRAGIGDEAFDLVVEASTQRRSDFSVMCGGLAVFCIGLGVEGVRLYRPTIWRMRAETTSPGMPCTLPARISSTRSATVELQAGLSAGSLTPWRASMSRSTNSATTSSGHYCASSTI